MSFFLGGYVPSRAVQHLSKEMRWILHEPWCWRTLSTFEPSFFFETKYSPRLSKTANVMGKSVESVGDVL